MAEFNLSSIDPYSYEPLRKQVYSVLRESILAGQIEPGEKITEVEIAEQLNVSRTPVREAFRMLELEELIIIVPQQGVFIAGIKSKKEIDDIFQVRIELEGLAACLAARNITDEQIDELNSCLEQIKECIKKDDLKRCIQIDITFHQIIKEASSNKWLEKYLDSLFEQITRFRAKSLAQEGRMEIALTDHKKLGSAITEGDCELARSLAKKHIRGAWESIKEVFEREHQDKSRSESREC
ncbi:MAG: GntR family transcriptional regulator [Halanaerobiaceae bacterium]